MRIDFNFEPLTEQELRDAPRPEPEEIKEPIVPVPADAPPLAFKHPEFGVPVKIWPYLDAQSNLVGYMGRFNDEDGNKYYYPLTYCRMGHETAWRAHGFPAPYPLYNLPDLVSCPDKQVLIVRGEANVDAAKLLFPYLVAVSAPYDDGLFSSADWSPLQGRHIIVFPHHDDREDSFISKVTSLVYRAGASSVRILRPESIAKICWRDGSKFSRPLIPERWDAAKAIEDGWTAEELAKHIGDFQNLRLQPKPLAYDRFRKPSFQMAQDGVEALHVNFH